MTQFEFEVLRHKMSESVSERMSSAIAMCLLVTLLLMLLRLAGIGEWLYCTFPLLLVFFVITGAVLALELYLILLERRVKND